MKIGIVGFGMVGREILHLLYNYPLIDEVWIVDLNPQGVVSEILDLEDSFPFLAHTQKIRVYVGDYDNLWDCQVVIVTASIPARAGGDRMSLLEQNAQLMKEIGKYFRNAPIQLKFIVVSNPVDIMAQVFLESSALQPKQVLSSGTNLETSRLKVLLSQWAHISTYNIQALVLGEHGNSAFTAWSQTRIFGLLPSEYARLRTLPPLDEEKMNQETLQRAWKIVEGKGYTDRGVGASVVQILSALLTPEESILPVGTLLNGQYGIHGVLMSLPCILNESGVVQTLEIPLTSSEQEALQKSADILKRAKEKIS